MSETKRISKTNILMVLQSPTDAKVQVKNESHFSIEKNTSFYSEFDAHSECLIFFQKLFGQKMALSILVLSNKYY